MEKRPNRKIYDAQRTGFTNFPSKITVFEMVMIMIGESSSLIMMK